LDIEYFDIETLPWQDLLMPRRTSGSSAATAPSAAASATLVATPTVEERYRQEVAAYVAAGGEESVQRVITAVHRLSRSLNQWYARQLSDLGLSAGEWAVLSKLVTAGYEAALTPSQLAEMTDIAASSMTHRLDRMCERGYVQRTNDPDNRTRVLVTLTPKGWEAFQTAIQGSNLVEQDVLASLSRRQREELASLLETVIAGLDETDAL